MQNYYFLLAHGSKEKKWAEPFRFLALNMSKYLSAPIELCFIEATPSLEEAVATLYEKIAESRRLPEQAKEVNGTYAKAEVKIFHILPAFLGSGFHVQQDIPLRVAVLQQRFPQVCFNVHPALGETEVNLVAIAASWVQEIRANS